jgi:hypothetical protein
VPFDLIAEQIGKGGAKRPVHLADRHFRFRGRARRPAGDEALAHSQDNAVSHAAFAPWLL